MRAAGDHDAVIMDPTLLSFNRVDAKDAVLLGAPLFTGPSLDEAWSGRCAELSRAVDRLQQLGAQDALILLRASFSSPRVMHLLRCSPSVDHDALAQFDQLLRTAICKLTNSVLTDMQWLQASLPVRMGGLGVRSVSSLALPAYLASAASTQQLQGAILSSTQSAGDSTLTAYLAEWQSDTGSDVQVEALPGQQSFWDRPRLSRQGQIVDASKVDAVQRAQYLASTAPHSGEWLLALPVASCGLRLDDEAVRVAVALRLGLSLGAPHSCRCGAMVDADGRHAFVCKKAPSRIARHQQLNDIVYRALVAAGVPASKEPVGLCRSDGKRPDGMSLIPWKSGKLLLWDVTVASTLADSYVASAARGAGEVAEQAGTRKYSKYADLSSAYHFVPLAMETLGPMTADALAFFNDLGHKLSSVTSDPREASYLFQRLSICIQRANAALFRECFVTHDEPDL